MNSSQALTLSAFYQARLQRLLAHQQAIEAELANRNLQDLPLEKLFRLSDLLSRQLQRLLKPAASSDVETAILPPIPAQPTSSQIKGNQRKSKQFKEEKASTHLVGTDSSTPSPTSSATSPSSQIKPDQASEAPSSEFKVPSSTFQVQGSPTQPDLAPSPPASNPIKPDQAADAPSSEFKVQGSPLPTLNSPPSTPLEHCLTCGAPLPPLLPNGRRPDRYCQCGNPMPGAPGTSLREHCPDCDALQPVHGYNAVRQENRCCKCGRDLPPLDPRSRTPWLPPARPVGKGASTHGAWSH